MNNAELACRFNSIRCGDKTAFEEIYNDMKTPVYTIIFRITRDESLSEDILQEVFVKLFVSPLLPSVKNPRAYASTLLSPAWPSEISSRGWCTVSEISSSETCRACFVPLIARLRAIWKT